MSASGRSIMDAAMTDESVTTVGNDYDPIPLSLVAHTVFCPRRAWLETAGERTDTAQVQHGTSAHRRSDDASESTTSEHRSLDVRHRQMGLVGRCDVVEGTAGGPLTIVEFKANPIRRSNEVAESTRVQLALQKLCLEDMGHYVEGTEVFFTSTRRRVEVTLEEDDYASARAFASETRKIVESSTAPPPLEDDPRCTRCSHVSVCLPDERAEEPVQRRIIVADPDTQVVHLATPGSRAGLRKGRLIVSKAGEQLGSVPLERVMGVVVHGNIDLSSALVRELSWRGQTLVWCSGTGRVYAWSQPAHSANGLHRVAQHVASASGRADIASEMVAAKIANQATILRRTLKNHGSFRLLRRLQKTALSAVDRRTLFGIEGEAASVYFSAFPELIRGKDRDFFLTEWTGRKGRGSTDPVNVLLNYSYTLLTAEMIRAVVACGLDPHAGFLHSSNRNKPALALDLVEEFRAPVADSVVLRLINNGEISGKHFHQTLGSTRLTDNGRRKLLSAFEKRMQTKITHPVFKYPASWRRTMEIQARMILGVLDGSQNRYVGVRVR